MKKDASPDYIRGQVDMFKTIQRLYFLTDFDHTKEEYVSLFVPTKSFEDIIKTDARTANEMWEKWLLFGRHKLAERLVGHPRYMGDSLEKSEEEYNRCQYDYDYRDKVEKQFNDDMKKLREAIEEDE